MHLDIFMSRYIVEARNAKTSYNLGQMKYFGALQASIHLPAVNFNRTFAHTHVILFVSMQRHNI
jgi:hypothetical protein